MKHTLFTLALVLLALLSASCGDKKKVVYQNPLPMAFGDPTGNSICTGRGEYRTASKYIPPMTW